jgi:predicted deacetylase
MHAEHLHIPEVWAATRATLMNSPLRWTIFVDPLLARIEGTDLQEPLSWLADNGHEVAMHTHHHLLQGEAGHTTGFLLGQPLDDSDIRRCLQENFDYLSERGHTPKGFVSGSWLVLDPILEWLGSHEIDYDSTLRTYAAANPDSSLTPNVPRSSVSRLGDLMEIPTTASLKQQLQADLSLRRRSVDVANLSYDLYYLHDSDLVQAKKRVAVRALGMLQHFAQSLTVHDLAERIGLTVGN